MIPHIVPGTVYFNPHNFLGSLCCNHFINGKGNLRFGEVYIVSSSSRIIGSRRGIGTQACLLL